MEAVDWDERYAVDELVWHAEPNRFLAEEAEGLSPGTALDLACGEGRNAVWLAEKGWRATGIDFSSVALSKAHRLAESRGVEVEWIEADLRTWRPSARYDLVVLCYVQLPPDQRRALDRAAAEAVAPGGRLVIVGHHLDNLEHGVGGPQHPDVLFTESALVDDIEGTGLVVERAERVRRPVATDDGKRDALDVVVRAVRA